MYPPRLEVHVTEPEQTGIELLLCEPEILAWLEPHESKDDDEEPLNAL